MCVRSLTLSVVCAGRQVKTEDLAARLAQAEEQVELCRMQAARAAAVAAAAAAATAAVAAAATAAAEVAVDVQSRQKADATKRLAEEKVAEEARLAEEVRLLKQATLLRQEARLAEEARRKEEHETKTTEAAQRAEDARLAAEESSRLAAQEVPHHLAFPCWPALHILSHQFDR